MRAAGGEAVEGDGEQPLVHGEIGVIGPGGRGKLAVAGDLGAEVAVDYRAPDWAAAGG